MSRRVFGGLTAAALAGVVTLTAAGCSNAPAPAPAPAGPTSTTAAPIAAGHNPADVTFAQAMIPHHAQAVAMATEARPRASSAQVKGLAGRIAAAQGPEIDQMNAMLSAWGAPTVSPSATAMPGMPGMPDMAGGQGGVPGMMSDAQMGQLATLSGPAFDREFLQMMISHHSGAITMARTELAQGLNPQAKALAGSIIADQQREIGEMQSLLTQR